MTLCTQEDVEIRLQWDITAEPDDVVTGLIAAAQSHIETEVGRTVESDEHTETFDGEAASLFLKYWPVTAVTEVVEDGTTLAADDYKAYSHGELIRVANGYKTSWRTRKRQAIQVTYTGGFKAGTHDLELAHLGSLCAEVVARAFRQGAASAAAPAGVGLGGISSVSLAGSDAVSFSTPVGDSVELGGGLSRFVFLLESEKADLGRYRAELA